MIDNSFVGYAFSSRGRMGSLNQIDVIDSKASVSEPTTEIKYLNQKVERLMMITEALWIILKETNNFTDEILKKKINEVDMKDGKLDGKVTPEPPGECSNCGKVLQKNKKYCIYCGDEVIIDDIFYR